MDIEQLRAIIRMFKEEGVTFAVLPDGTQMQIMPPAPTFELPDQSFAKDPFNA